ncbi:hypothetical protein RPC_0559 [Rhodopseudomonas palustris BisB18]|uniref:Uncharacterized protein n=2 Tax=Rhodopseudomonas palustris TaxID=1076 RepID=Q21BV2_RHOPB
MLSVALNPSRIAKGLRSTLTRPVDGLTMRDRFAVKPIDHSQVYGFGAACHAKQSEEYFARLRRAEIGIHRHRWRLPAALC